MGLSAENCSCHCVLLGYVQTRVAQDGLWMPFPPVWPTKVIVLHFVVVSDCQGTGNERRVLKAVP